MPNSFHLKDQVLAQLADEKRQTAEARMAARERQRAGGEDEEEEEDTPGIVSMSGNVVARKPLSGAASLPVDEEDEDVPALFDSNLPTLQAALDEADVMLEVVDARDIAGGRSAHVEKLVSESDGTVWIVVNKADLVPREALEAWLGVLPYPAYIFSAREGLGREQLVEDLSKLAKKKGDEFKAALVGLPNVGKSSVLNTLLGRDQARVAAPVPQSSQAKDLAPTTGQCSEYPVTDTIRIIDTPGWEYVEESDDEEEEGDEEDPEKWDRLEARVAGDLLRRNLGRVDRVKDVFPLSSYIIERSNAQDMMLKYNVPFFEAGDIEAFMTGLARVNQRVKKFGEPNHDAAARILLRDWATSEFPYYTAPAAEMDMEVEVEQPDNSAVLAACKTRKELKAARGLVRFRSSEVDEREVFLDDDYTAVDLGAGEDDEDDEEDEEEHEEEHDEDEEDHDEDDAEGLLIGSDEGEELDLEDGPEPTSPSSLDDEEDESESESSPEPPSRKRKARASLPSDTRKKSKTVSFKQKPEPRSSKREVSEVKGILKRSAPDSPAKPSKRAREASPEVKEKRAKVVKTKEAKPSKAKPQPQPKAAKTKGSSEGEAYDFSQHF